MNKKQIFYSFLALFTLGFHGLSWAQGMEGPPPPPDQSFVQTMVMLTIAIAFFYLILWRPEQKRRKQVEEQRDSMKKGDRVTAMGIVGTISKVQESTVIVKMYDGSKLEFLKAAISDVQQGSSDDAKRVELSQQAE